MRRRHFIQAAAASVFLPADLAAFSATADYAFFDERFDLARRVAASWRTSNGSIAVQSDITPVWGDGLDHATRRRALWLRGVTTESFRFCLEILVRERADFELLVFRLDRNVFLWTMHTTPRLRAERRNV